MADNFGLKIGIEGEREFKQSLAEINSSFKVLGSEMKLAISRFDANEKSVESLTAKNEVLQKQIDAQKSKIEVLRAALQNATESFGENDKRTQNWAIALNNAEAELNGMQRQLQKNTDEINGMSSGLNDAEKNADEFGDEVEDAGKQSEDAGGKFEALGGVCKAVAGTLAAAFAAVSAAAIAAGKALVDMATDGAAYADSVLTESTVTGIATDKLQEYMYAAELVDVSTETLTKSMAKQIKSMKSAQDGSKAMVEAYDKLGVSVTDTEGNLRDSDTVYWELIDALGNVENETERDALAIQILGKSAQELNPLITAGAERMEELGKQAREAGYVVSDDMLSAYGALDDQMQYLSVGATAAKNALGTILLPVLTELAGTGVNLLGEFTNGILDANGDLGKMGEVIGEIMPKILDAIMKYVPQLISLIGTIVKSLGQAIVKNLPAIVKAVNEIVLSILGGLASSLPQIAESALTLVLTLVDGILENLPQILETGIQVIVSLVEGIANALPTLIPAIVQALVLVVQTIIGNLDMILDAALQLVQGLADGILAALPVLIAALPEIITSIVTFIINAIPQIINAGIQLLTSLVDALPTIILAIVEAIPQIIDGIIKAVIEAIPLIIDAGIRLLTALIDNLPVIILTIVNAIPDIITGIINAVLDNIPLINQAGITLFTALIQNLPQIIIEIVKAVPDIIGGIISAFGKGVSQMAEVGKNLVKGLWEGIKSLASWIWDKVSSWASDLWDGICDFFGIHSPSRKMAWVGDMMMTGLANGIDDTAGEAISAAEDMTANLNDIFNGLSADLASTMPEDIRVQGGAVGGSNANTGGFVLHLNIDNFNNYSGEDITELTEEIMTTAGAFVQRKGAVFA